MENISEVLTPSLIDLTEANLPAHLRGSAWLWLLRAGEMKSPKQGYLRIDRRGISVRGLPRYIEAARNFIWNRQKKKEAEQLLKTLQTALSGKFNTNIEPGEFETLVQGGRKYGSLLGDLVRQWNSLSAEERSIFHEAIRMKPASFGEMSWYNDASIIKALLRGTYEWQDQRIDFERPLGISAYPQEVALHGIFLPAGLLSWNPMDGSSEKLPLLVLPGGVRLDVRGPAAPVPAASRLFVDSRNADKVLVPMTRSVLRHAFKLPADNPSADGWEEWIDDLLVAMTESFFEIAFRAFMEERELLQSFSKYLVMTGEESIYLSHQEVVQKFGSCVPIRGMKYAKGGELVESRDGLNLDDGRTSVLVALKVRRRREDGFWEVDIERDAPIQEILEIQGTFSQFPFSLWGMQYIKG